jgi:uncharacterized protein
MLISVTLLYAGILGVLLVLMSFNILHHWVRVTGEGMDADQAMRRAEKVQASFVEYAPLTLILLALIELKGAPEPILHGLGIVFVLARLFHAFATSQSRGADIFRFLGTQLTYLVVMICSLGCIYYFGLSAR